MRESGQPGPSAAEIIELLGLAAHPEGGFYRETFRDTSRDTAGRAASSLIYFLLAEGDVSAWHRIDAVEVWHYYAGAPLHITVRGDGIETSLRLGNDLAGGERPQCIVPAGAWQTAKCLGAWTLVGCMVAPAFDFAGFELAGPDGYPSRPGAPQAASADMSASVSPKHL